MGDVNADRCEKGNGMPFLCVCIAKNKWYNESMVNSWDFFGRAEKLSVFAECNKTETKTHLLGGKTHELRIA
jgi:hypothetical protein